MSALILAALRGRDDLIPLLVSGGAALEHADPAVGGVVNAAVIGGHPATVEILLDAGAPVGVRNRGGATELHFAAFTGQHALVERFLAMPGLPLDVTNFWGGTPLRAAAASGHADVVQRLLALGADPAPVDDFDRRPIDDARDAGHAEVVALLEAAATPTRVSARRVRWVPFAQLLPAREDAALKGVLHGIRTANPVGSSFCSAVEAPSVLAAIRVVLRDFEFSCHVDCDPDPRLPARQVKTQLWTYRRLFRLAQDARPAVPRPPGVIEAAIAAVAESPYVLRVWSDVARRAAGTGTIPATALPEVLATMVH
jgi:hypothetical protein